MTFLNQFQQIPYFQIKISNTWDTSFPIFFYQFLQYSNDIAPDMIKYFRSHSIFDTGIGRNRGNPTLTPLLRKTHFLLFPNLILTNKGNKFKRIPMGIDFPLPPPSIQKHTYERKGSQLETTKKTQTHLREKNLSNTHTDFSFICLPLKNLKIPLGHHNRKIYRSRKRFYMWHTVI